VKEAEHTDPVQNDGFPVASSIAFSIPERQDPLIDVQDELELMTA